MGVSLVNKRCEWLLLIVLAAAGIFLWYRFSFPRYQSIDLSINQARAVVLADKFLSTQRGVDTHPLSQWLYLMWMRTLTGICKRL